MYEPGGTEHDPTYSTLSPAVSRKEPGRLPVKASNKEDAVAPCANFLPLTTTVFICEYATCKGGQLTLSRQI